MPHVVHVREYPGAAPDEVFRCVADFDRYPSITTAVRSVRTTRTEESLRSEWEVNFRKGVLRWVELDTVDVAACRTTFEQVSGDMAEFTGEWTVEPTAGGARITFRAYFDLGMPSLADMLDPVAERALLANVDQLMDAFAAASGDSAVGAAGLDADSMAVGR